MQENYSLDGLEERAAAAHSASAAYLAELAEKYRERCVYRAAQHLLPIGICGMGRAGKDTAAEFLCARTRMKYPGSASMMTLPLVTNMVCGTTLVSCQQQEAVFAARHAHREFWIAACHALRGSDYSLMVRMCLGAGDVAVGIRGRLELEEVVSQKVVGLTLWIDNPRVPIDPTVEYGPGDCDLMIPNHGSLMDLYAKLRKFVELLRAGAFNPE